MIVELQMGPTFQQTINEMGKEAATFIDRVSEGLGKGVKLAAGTVKQNYLSGQSLKRRTGSLARAVDGWLDSPLDGVVGIPENTAVNKYKWLLGDEQMTIRPTNAKFLTIPIGENLTGAGVARFTSPRQVPDGFFVRTGGKLLFGRKNGKKGKFRPLFILVKSVFVQGSGALADGVMDSTDDIADEIEKSLDKGQAS